MAVLWSRNRALERCLALAGLVLRDQAGQLQKWKFSCSGELRGKGGADFFAADLRCQEENSVLAVACVLPGLARARHWQEKGMQFPQLAPRSYYAFP